MSASFKNNRILGIDPCPRGFGFVVFDAPAFLNDWGVAKVASNETSSYLVRIVALIERYQPDVVALPRPADYKRRPLLKRLVSALIRLTIKRSIIVRIVSRDSTVRTFGPYGNTKYDRSLRLTILFPELKASLPPPRKIWNSEDMRMNIFDALALVVACPEAEGLASKTAQPDSY